MGFPPHGAGLEAEIGVDAGVGQGVALLVGRRADKPLLEHVPKDGFEVFFG